MPLLNASSSENQISCHTLNQLIHGEFQISNQYVLLDARYEYEYEGGSIKGAINVTDPTKALEMVDQYLETNTMVIVFCEFSQKRGPRLYR